MRSKIRTWAGGCVGVLCVVLVAGCGDDDVCMQACDKIGECANVQGTVMGCNFTERECSGSNRCAAECVVSASCEELSQTPETGSEDSDYWSCVSACYGITPPADG